MRIAIPQFQDRVSPVFESARELVVWDVDADRIEGRRAVSMAEVAPLERPRWLKDQGVDVLLCGALTCPLAAAARSLGIEVVTCLAGSVDEVAAAYVQDGLVGDRFLLPRGCRGGGGRRMRRRGRQGSQGA